MSLGSITHVNLYFRTQLWVFRIQWLINGTVIPEEIWWYSWTNVLSRFSDIHSHAQAQQRSRTIPSQRQRLQTRIPTARIEIVSIYLRKSETSINNSERKRQWGINTMNDSGIQRMTKARTTKLHYNSTAIDHTLLLFIRFISVNK